MPQRERLQMPRDTFTPYASCLPGADDSFISMLPRRFDYVSYDYVLPHFDVFPPTYGFSSSRHAFTIAALYEWPPRRAVNAPLRHDDFDYAAIDFIDATATPRGFR